MPRTHAFFEPGEVASLECGVCQSAMEVRRNVLGPRTVTEAMSKCKVLHDAFFCPYRAAAWHLQAAKLLEHAESTPSARLDKMYREEADKIVRRRVATKA